MWVLEYCEIQSTHGYKKAFEPNFHFFLFTSSHFFIPTISLTFFYRVFFFILMKQNKVYKFNKL